VPGPLVELRDVEVHYSGARVLSIPRLELQEGEILTVLGPNGAGKSTLMRILALIEEPEYGEAFYRGAAVPRGPARLPIRRRFTVIFQEPLLADTTVLGNVEMGLRFRGVPRQDRRRRVQPWLERLGLSSLTRRRTSTLSGGEAQRTSLARAFVLEPEVLLLDEPFSSLDPPAREEMLLTLKEILESTGTTAVLVTHDRDEAFLLGDRVVALINGRVAQVGDPEDLRLRPASGEVARLVGFENLWSATALPLRSDVSRAEVGGRQILLPSIRQPGKDLLLGVRAEEITLLRTDAPEAERNENENRFQGNVTRVIPKGPLLWIEVDCGFPLVGFLSREELRKAPIPGERIIARFPVSCVRCLPPPWPENSRRDRLNGKQE